ncbi:agmatinase [Methylocystis sp. 9N]|uniref:Agmatinase n=1 Tax=Methylocystis borbori TaxID=3118750 RepID=A0ABU7XI28_9HYPH
MSSTPTFAAAPGFLGLARRAGDAAIAIAGVPFDIGTTNRSGARFGPFAIRHASRMLIDGDHPAHWTSPSILPLADVGDFAIALGDIAASLKLIEEQASAYAHLVTLGGDHGITLPLLRACAKRHGPLALIHFDAHVDTWPDNFGQPYAHGSMFYHAINEGIVDPRRMIQIGIRSPVGRDVYDWTLGQGVTIVPAQEAHEIGPAAVAAKIREVAGEGPVYLSFDVDALDPAFAPGTGTPEIGGLASWQAQAILRRLEGLNFVGMDVVEVAPAYDISEITALAAATMAWEYLSLLAARETA